MVRSKSQCGSALVQAGRKAKARPADRGYSARLLLRLSRMRFASSALTRELPPSVPLPPATTTSGTSLNRLAASAGASQIVSAPSIASPNFSDAITQATSQQGPQGGAIGVPDARCDLVDAFIARLQQVYRAELSPGTFWIFRRELSVRRAILTSANAPDGF